MTTFDQEWVHVLAELAIGVMLVLCLSSRSGAATSGRQVYRVHGVWYVFSALGGALLVGIFAVVSAASPPGDRAGPAWCSVAFAIFFIFFAAFMRSLRVIIDEDRVTARNFLFEQSVALREIDRVAVVGMVVEARMKEDPVTKKRPRPLIFLAGFRGLQELMATIRARAGLPAAGS